MERYCLFVSLYDDVEKQVLSLMVVYFELGSRHSTCVECNYLIRCYVTYCCLMQEPHRLSSVQHWNATKSNVISLVVNLPGVVLLHLCAKAISVPNQVLTFILVLYFGIYDAFVYAVFTLVFFVNEYIEPFF